MLRRLPRSLGARAVAALVALVISGAPRVALALRAAGEHVCQCRSHGDGHRCACPVCAEQLRRARRGQLDRLPPCHRKLALADLEREEEAERTSATAPSFKPSCGFDLPGATLPDPERFVAPAATALAPPLRAEPLAPASDDARESPAVPDVPPPIPGR